MAAAHSQQPRYWSSKRDARVCWPQLEDEDAPRFLTRQEAQELACAAALHTGQDHWASELGEHRHWRAMPQPAGPVQLLDMREQAERLLKHHEELAREYLRRPKDMPVLARQLAWEAHFAILRELGLLEASDA